MQDIGCVRVRPAAKTKAALFVAFLSFYKGGTPETEARLRGIDSGVVTLDLEGARGARTLTLDMANAKVGLSG